MSSLKGLRTVSEVYFAVSLTIVVTTDEELVPWSIYLLVDSDMGVVRGEKLDRNSDRKIAAGRYMVYPDKNTPPPIIFPMPLPLSTRRSKTLAADNASVPSGSTTASLRDNSASLNSFKSRLIVRDETCVICHAAGIEREVYHYDSLDCLLFEAAHIVAVQYRDHWGQMRLKDIVRDSYTEPGSPDRGTEEPEFPTTLSRLRMHSLENGLLLCLEHHKMYDNCGFTIRPETHDIYAFHPRCASLHGKKVTKPWLFDDLESYPAPADMILHAHCFISATRALNVGEEYDDDGTDSEGEEFELAGFADSKEIEEKDVSSWAAQVAEYSKSTMQ